MKKVFLLFVMLGLTLTFGLKVNGLETNSDELRDGLFYEDKTNIVSEDFEYEIKKICRLDEGFIVVGKAEDKEELPPHLDFFITYPYIAYYDSEGLVWSFVDKQIGHGEYNDAVVVNNEVVAIGTYEVSDSYPKLLMTRFNNNGNVKARVNFDANKATFGYRLLFESNKFYIVGLTNATYFLEAASDAIEKVFVLKMSTSFQQEKIVFINNNGLSNLYDACMANGFIYIHCRLSGEGDYDIDSQVPVDSLISMDSNLDQIYHSIIYRKSFMKIACNEDGLYVFYSDGLLRNLTIEEYDIGLHRVHLSYPFNDRTDETINSMAVSSSDLHEPVSVYMIAKNHDTHSAIYMSINPSLDIKLSLTREIENERKAESVFIANDYFYLFSDFSSTKEVCRLVYLIEDAGVVYGNGMICRSEKEAINTDVFGTYKQKITHYFSDIEIYTYVNYVVPIKVSIKDRSVYDRRVQLIFNGQGFLNNTPIESGYIVTEEGQYVLEVRGKDETKYFTFEVRKLVITENSFELEEPSVTYNKTTGINVISSASYSDQPASSLSMNNFSEQSTSNNYIVIMAVALGIILGVFIPLERIFKKHKEDENV